MRDPSGAAALQTYLDTYFSGYSRINSSANKVKPYASTERQQLPEVQGTVENLNRDAVLRYELDAALLTDRIITRIATDFEVRPLTPSVTRTESVQSLHQAKSTETPYLVLPQSVLYVLSEFVRELANLTKLS